MEMWIEMVMKEKLGIYGRRYSNANGNEYGDAHGMMMEMEMEEDEYGNEDGKR